MSKSPAWTRWPRQRLLDTRLCDLGLTMPGSLMEDRLQELENELEQRGIRFRPHFWISDEWFSPAGIPGIAVPFYLTHPRLMRLEKNQMLEVEGGSRSGCLRILRHETGHALAHGFRLHRRARWRQVFGPASRPYPVAYRPRPFSRRFVQHLDSWYAQSHPDEDFAETFAVWLSCRPTTWRRRYAGWPALGKLEYVDELMADIGSRRPVLTTRRQLDPVHQLRKTLKEHYEERRLRYGIGGLSRYDRELVILFSAEPRHARRESAAGFLRSLRPEVLAPVSRWTGQTPYTVDQVLREIAERCRVLKLRLRFSRRRTREEVAVLLAVYTAHHLQRGRMRLYL